MDSCVFTQVKRRAIFPFEDDGEIIDYFIVSYGTKQIPDGYEQKIEEFIVQQELAFCEMGQALVFQHQRIYTKFRFLPVHTCVMGGMEMSFFDWNGNLSSSDMGRANYSYIGEIPAESSDADKQAYLERMAADKAKEICWLERLMAENERRKEEREKRKIRKAKKALAAKTASTL